MTENRYEYEQNVNTPSFEIKDIMKVIKSVKIVELLARRNNYRDVEMWWNFAYETFKRIN